ncbi:hypothetical protein RND81_04G003600 [Saponaria officinalis]
MSSVSYPWIPIVPSEELSGSELHRNDEKRMFATFVMNMTTNLRIWKALHPNPRFSNTGLIENLLQYEPSGDGENHSVCDLDVNCNVWRTNVMSHIRSFRLDESQTNAVLSSISMVKCSHKANTVKLIWGPPGTGKTKTVASLLFGLLKLKCRTLTCAPTNTAVLQVAERLVKLFLGSVNEYDTYGLGDIVLFGNGERMKIDEHEELVDVFLRNRVKTLVRCFSPLDGWKINLVSMICLLENPREEYNTYLHRNAVKLEPSKTQNKKKSKETVNQSVNENEKKKKDLKKDPKTETGETTMTFEEFVKKTFRSLAEHLIYCAKNLYTHLPTSVVPLDVAKQMILLIALLKKLQNSEGPSQFSDLMMKKEQLLPILKELRVQFPRPKIKGSLSDFCLAKACLIFCTASGSIKMLSPVKMVIIDEAAQLKECESAIPLQIPGVTNAVLIGDDRQLPAMVQSKVSGDMNFGRSLFQRLATLGKKKHMLNIQYRMHPTISSFPNQKFYENSIVDASHVKLRSYTRTFLKENMYGSYTFINVSTGKENFKKGRSPRNVEEAAVVNHIIGKLYSYHCNTSMAISVGVISPYKGQVGLMNEKFGKKYAERKGNGFTVNVRSVDGFQGGEEDVIIISTVRSNGNGSVGFLSNHQRTNVALTRARYCLWIVGSGSTLENSGTVWQDLVTDAKTRGCFYDADDVAEFKDALKPALTKRSRQSLAKFDISSLDLSEARWKVVFGDNFKASLARTESIGTRKQVTEMVKKIANGWSEFNSENVVNLSSFTVELLELYKVDDQLYLAWSTDIQEEDSKYTQVIKVWSLLSAYEIPKLVKDLSNLFGRYTVNTMDRCKHKSYQGNLVVPISWPLHSVINALPLADPAECLSNQLANTSSIPLICIHIPLMAIPFISFLVQHFTSKIPKLPLLITTF